MKISCFQNQKCGVWNIDWGFCLGFSWTRRRTKSLCMIRKSCICTTSWWVHTTIEVWADDTEPSLFSIFLTQSNDFPYILTPGPLSKSQGRLDTGRRQHLQARSKWAPLSSTCHRWLITLLFFVSSGRLVCMRAKATTYIGRGGAGARITAIDSSNEPNSTM